MPKVNEEVVQISRKAKNTIPATIYEGKETIELRVGGRKESLTNLQKPFWPDLGISKGDLLQYGRIGDLWQPMLAETGRASLENFL